MRRIGKIDLKKKYLLAQRRKMEAMRYIANNSVNFFKVTIFEAQGFIFSGGANRWKKRKNKTDRPNRKILVDTGHGRQSIKAALITPNRVIIRTEAEYMRYHNDGTKNLPQRKFIGHSVKLDKQNIAILVRKMRGVL